MARKIFFLMVFAALLSSAFAIAMMPNPASVFCESQGYTLEIREGEGGQYGVCVFPSGECEEWKYFRGECLGPGDTGMRPPQDSFGQNLSSCDEFRDAEVCPSLWQPVCARIEKGNSAPYEIEWKTFANLCIACTSSTRSAVVSGYYMGACASSACEGHALGESYPAPDGCNTCTCTETGSACTEMYCLNDSNPQPDGHGEPGADLCQSLFILSGALVFAGFACARKFF
ncbi:MAG: DUF333 domain-containing protein [Candidatus Micrarchaeota archaeon]|nr:DUF333 domain-containing protein [Candidatus Micrarchaeota archaeon]